MKEPRQYRRQPIKVQAIQYTGDNWGSVKAFADPEISRTEMELSAFVDVPIIIETRWGAAIVQQTDWVVRSSYGTDVVVLDDDEFQKTHGR